MKPIYLDNAATTPVWPAVVKAMIPYFTGHYGNASSSHALGEEALQALTHARTILGKEIGARPHEIIFTSGGTESNNLALAGLAAKAAKKKIIISDIEHSSVREVAEALRQRGYKIERIPVNEMGVIDTPRLAGMIDSNTLLVSVIHASNELGVLQDIALIGKLCRQRSVIFHTDAVQSFGKEKIDVRSMNIDMLSACAHKLGGPKGIGLLYVREGVSISPIIIGGGQERGTRGGTENIAAAAGFAKALQITKKVDMRKMSKLRDYFEVELEKLGGRVNGKGAKRLPGIINVSFPGRDGQMIVLKLSMHGIMCSTKSACLSRQHAENKVLQAIGLDSDHINGTVRFSISPSTTQKDIDFVVRTMNKFIAKKNSKQL